jgi:hypothetical protein
MQESQVMLINGLLGAVILQQAPWSQALCSLTYRTGDHAEDPSDS